MTASLSSFQSIIQLGSGTSLAIFALPKLGTTEMEVEKARWASTVRAVKLRAGDSIPQLSGLGEFRNDMQKIEERAGYIRVFALGVSAVSAGYLVWMSAYPDDPPDSYTVLVLLICMMPPLAMLYNYITSRSRLKSSRRHRLAINEPES